MIAQINLRIAVCSSSSYRRLAAKTPPGNKGFTQDSFPSVERDGRDP